MHSISWQRISSLELELELDLKLVTGAVFSLLSQFIQFLRVYITNFFFCNSVTFGYGNALKQVRTSIYLRQHLFEFSWMRVRVSVRVCASCSVFTFHAQFPVWMFFGVDMFTIFCPPYNVSAPVFIVRQFIRLYALVYCFCQHRISTPKNESS